MTQSEQISFVNELCMRMALDIATKIDDGEVPDHWDGHELRCLVADKAANNAEVSTVRKNPKHARAKAYKNTIITTNLL